MKKIFFIPVLLCSIASLAQRSGPAYTGQYNFANGDPGVAYNKYMVAREDRTYTQIGNYRVLGSSYLLGKRHLGNLFAKGETGYNIFLSYNTYNQEVEFYTSSNPGEPLVKEPGTVDSFVLKRDTIIPEDLRFIYGSHLQTSDRAYYQVVREGPRFHLYKKYHAAIGMVSTNYIEGNLRQFEMEYDYWYYDVSKKQLKKLKPSANALKKEFSRKDLPITEEQLSYNKEAALIGLFTELNKN